MFFSRWTLLQVVTISLLGIVAFITDLFKEEIAISQSTANSDMIIRLLMTLLFLIIVIGLISLLIYFQTKKSPKFLINPIRNKVHIFISLLFVISLMAFMSISLTYIEFVQNNRWVIYMFLYYFVLLINIIVLSILHRKKKNSSAENELYPE